MNHQERQIDIDDQVILTSESPIFSDLEGELGTVLASAGSESDPEFSVEFSGGHIIKGLHKEDIELFKKSQWEDVCQ